MAVGSQQYAVTGTASIIAAGPGDALPGTSQPLASASVTVTTTANAFLGGSNVTSANGLPITSAMAPLTIPLFPGDVLYAVASTTATVNVLQT
jgi:hypothetical protein